MHSRFFIDISQIKGVFALYRSVSVKLVRTGVEATQALEVQCVTMEESKSDPLAHLSEERRDTHSLVCEKFPDVLTSKLGLTSVIEYTNRLTN